MLILIKKHKGLVIALCLLLLAGGVALVLRATQYRGGTAISLKEGPVVEAVYGLGTVTARHTYELKMGITTTVKKTYIQEGDHVQAGQTLVTFDEGQVSKAPFAGVITRLAFKDGESVFPQVPVLALSDLTERYITVTLEQQGALRVKAAQRARLSFESLRAERFEGVVRSIFPSEGQFVVHIDVAQLPAAVLPGMTADVAIEVSRRDMALLIPVSAINGGQVVRDRDGQHKKIPVKIGTVDGEWAEMTGGDLKSGDQVFVRTQ